MKRLMIVLGIAAGATVIVLTCAGLYKHFITDRTMDKGGMENPNAAGTTDENQEVSETAELVSFCWYQGDMSYDRCFSFELSDLGQEEPVLYCDYVDAKTGEHITLGDSEYDLCPPVPTERWAELASFLRTAELPPYHAPDPNLLDATNSLIHVQWREGSEQFTNNYNGIQAYDLLALLTTIAQEVSAAMPESASGSEPG